MIVRLAFRNYFLILASAIIYSSCNPVETKDQNRFEPVTPSPAPTLNFSTISDVSGSEGSTIITGTLSCSASDGRDIEYFSVVSKHPKVKCRYESALNVIACELGYIDGHADTDVDITAYCNIDNNSAKQTFTLTVNDVNRSPALDSITDQVVYVDSSISEINADDSGTDYDQDEDPLTYACEFTGGVFGSATDCSSLPGSNSFDTSTGVLNWTPNITAASGGSTTVYSFTITGSDDQSPSLDDSQDFDITVNAVTAPSYISSSPATPSNTTTTPLTIGSSSADTTNINLYSDSSCTVLIGSGSKSSWEGAGITTTITANSTTSIYAQALDADNNRSTCTFMVNYVHDNTPPTDPVFSSINPTSPSNSDNNPEVIGSSSADTTTITLYSDSLCTTSVGSGTKATFEGAGITASLNTNATTTIYARAFDSLLNQSSCVLMTSYTHDNIAPANPAFSATNPVSPSNSITDPYIMGTSSADTVSLNLYSNALCSTQIGSGTKSQFESAGIQVSVSANATTSIYALSYDSANNSSACTLLTSYTHDNDGPTDPVFSSTSPASPNNSSISPAIIGTSSADTSTLTFYSDNLCTAVIGSGTKAQFEGAGVTLAVSANSTTSIYAKAFDSFSNNSNCVAMTSYTHDNTAPTNPSFISTSPSSPTSVTTSPSIIGSASADTSTLNFYSENTCTTGIGSGSKADFESSGISINVTANSTTTIYVEALDSLSNTSACTLLTSFTHDNTGPTDPTFSSTSPVSPSNSDLSPEVIGASSADTVSISLYSNASCTTQIGSGTKATFEGAGISATVSSNATTTIYAIAFDSLSNSSNCTTFTSYTHDSTGPSDPSFSALSPTSPSNSSTTPSITGASSGDTISINFYSDSSCSSSIGSGTKAQYEGAGISLTVSANATTSIYARALDSLSNTSSCTLLSSYTHDNVAPSVAVFSSTSPASPSSTVTTPNVIGTTSSDTVNVYLYNENTCAVSIGSGTKATYESAGIQISASSNATTSIYATTSDAAGNISACTFLANYIHDNTGPSNPTFSSTSPASPSSSDTTPEVIGSSSADTASIILYSDSICTASIGSGTKATFEGVGISATVSSNATTNIYAKAFDSAGNASSCTALSSYTHDNTGPVDPTFSNSTPSSPSSSSTTPSIIGSASADTVSINLYSENTCSTGIGSGSKANFESAGITATVSANTSTTIYARAQDSLANLSNCVLLLNYTHDNTGPTDPSFSSTSPVSPSNSDLSPEVIGSSSADTVTVNIYNEATCSTQIGSGTKALFEGAGITISASSNATTLIYARAYDSLNNVSNCTLLSTYTHDNTGPTDPTFSSITPNSPNNTSTTPSITGNSSGDTDTLNFYSDSSCTTGIGSGSKALFEGAGISLTVNANSTTSIYSRALDSSSNTSSCVLMTTYTHDNVAPGDVTSVSDGDNSTSITNTPVISWSASSDATSGIAYYEVSIGTSAGNTDTVNWTNVGITTSTSITSISPNLVSGTTYYANVRAVDNAGNTSPLLSGDGWLVDATAPSSPTVTFKGCTTTTLSASWTTSSDSESGVDRYEYSLGTSSGDDDVIAWTDNALSTTLSLSGETLTEAQSYYLNVKAFNTLGSESSVSFATATCTDIQTSLQGFWRLEEAAGLRTDEQGNNDLIANGLVAQAGGKLGNAQIFNSVTSDYLSTVDGGELTVSDIDFTISAWVYVSNNLITQPIITKWDGSTNEYYLEYLGSTGFRFRVDTGSVTLPIAVSNNTWYHVVAWHDEASNTVNISVNGSLPTSSSYSLGATGGDSIFNVGAQASSVQYFSGRIDAIGLWKKVLSSHERDLIYNSGTGLEL